MPGGCGFRIEIRDLIDGVNGLSFARAATKDEHTRDEMERTVVLFLAAMGRGFLAHYRIGNADWFATMMALDAAEIRFCGDFGRHG